jgi:arylsulfatase A-like enzyme
VPQAGKLSSRYKHRVDERLNVVVILSDDERWDGTGVMQNVKKLLVDHGVNFTNAHVTTSMCGPSRASILTGQYSHHTGVFDNFGRHSYPAFNAGEESNDLAVWMHRAGYKTGLVGKYVNSYTDGFVDHAVPPGWDDWQVMDSVPMEAYYNYSINNNGHIENYGNKPSDYSTTVLTHKAVNFIHRARHPFFLYFAPVAPHLPAIPAKRDQGKLQNIAPIHSPAFNQRNIGKEPWRFWHKDLLSAGAQLYINHVRIRQEESLLALDRSVRSVVQELKDRHELDHTVIIYTSDNGFLWGEHRLGGKVWPYQESTHVPMIVRAPWTTKPQRNNQPVLNIDLAPTISELAGIKPELPRTVAASSRSSTASRLPGATHGSRSTSARTCCTKAVLLHTSPSRRGEACTSSTRTAGASSTT